MAGTILIIIAVIILIVGAFVSLHFWFHVFFILSPPEAVAFTPTSTSLNNIQLLLSHAIEHAAN